jgi:outer membrane murein-binding lipoprotein Lpp
MKRWFVLASLILSGLIIGCASDRELQAVQADTTTLQRRSSTQHQTVAARVQQLSDRVAQFEQAQIAARRDLARINAALDELRVQLQRLRGDAQETQIQEQRRGTRGGEDISAASLANLEARLNDLEKQLREIPQ